MQRRAVISVDKAGQSILGNEFMQVLGQGVCRLGHDFLKERVLAEEIADEQVLFAFVGEVVSCNHLPQAIRDIAGKHGLCRGRGFVLGAGSALADINSYISVDAGSVHCLSCLCLHHFYPLVGSVQVSKDMAEEVWGNTDAASLEEEAGLYGQLVLGVPKMSGDPWDLLSVIQPSPQG